MSDPAAAIPAPIPLISVIVRSMDRPSLPTALGSIAAQDQAPLEVLVVNARGPGHAAVPAMAGPHPVRWVDHGHGLRRSAAANAGLDAAAGQWVIFLDDDDLFLPGHVSRLAAALQQWPDAAAAYADVAYGRQGADGWSTEHVFGADFDPLRLRFENFLPLHAVLVRRTSAGLRGCRFDEELDLFEDWDWWLQLSRLGNFVHVRGISAHYVAADDGGSGVFSDDTKATRSREQLLRKWLALDAAEDQLALLLALQQQYRAAQLGAEQAAARQQERVNGERQVASLQTLIAAREHELAALSAALERERKDRDAEGTALHSTLQARERELSDTRVHTGNLERTVAARDVEIANLKARVDCLLAERPLEAFTRALRNRKHERSQP